jgi:hypothetical protein
MIQFRLFLPLLIAVLVFGYGPKSAGAQSNGVFIPLIGITSVPKPLSLPSGPGNVTYSYAVKNFLSEAPLTNVQVADDKCRSVKFTEGDDNHDNKLDYSETWRYTCTTKVSVTTQNTATATGSAFGLSAIHQAYSTVVVGSNTPPPLVSIVNVTKVAYPLSLPAGGGSITFTYKVNNPGEVPLSDVSVVDNKCSAMSGKLGDTNGNNLLDINEVWIYTCTTQLSQTTTNTVGVTAFANGLKAVGYATLTVRVATSPGLPTQPIPPNLPETGNNGLFPTVKNTVWAVLAVLLLVLMVLFYIRKRKHTWI